MLQPSTKFGRYASIVAACFCLFALARTVRPFESLALSNRPAAATRYQELTRHTVEDFDSQIYDAQAPVVSETDWPIPQIVLSRPSPRPAVVQARPIRRALISRRIVPAPDYSH